MTLPIFRRARLANAKWLAALVFSGGLTLTTVQAGLLINVDFNGGQFGASAGSTQTGAAVIGSTGDFWNGFGTSDTASNQALKAADGTSSGASLSYSVAGGYSPYGSGGNGQGNGFGNPSTGSNPDAALMSDFFSNYSTTVPSTVTLTGLPASAAFNLYVYSENNSSSGNPAIFSLTGAASTLTLTPSSALSTFVSPATNATSNNYGILQGTSDGTGTLVISFLEGTSGAEADFNGFQLSQAVPEPSTVCASVFAVVLVGLGVRHRFRFRPPAPA